MSRQGIVKRETRETTVEVRLDLDGGNASPATGLPFLDHMLDAMACHGHLGLAVSARGDLQVDAHHTVEDVGLVFGQALRQAVGDRAGLRRYGWAYVPMDEALARAVVDLSGRPGLAYRAALPNAVCGGFDSRLVREFFQALVNTGCFTLHLDLLAGDDVHHAVEAMFKAFGRALGQAIEPDPRCTGIPSTKGVLDG
ncbi:MAG: imidazoleglycerol-phosphate dehydratase HisB [Lentisphaeria bacterium]|nr:imidazoleglycerol-phosphate dehydratase HisB [Lentisphaeria bacterium]